MFGEVLTQIPAEPGAVLLQPRPPWQLLRLDCPAIHRSPSVAAGTQTSPPSSTVLQAVIAVHPLNVGHGDPSERRAWQVWVPVAGLWRQKSATGSQLVVCDEQSEPSATYAVQTWLLELQ